MSQPSLCWLQFHATHQAQWSTWKCMINFDLDAANLRARHHALDTVDTPPCAKHQRSETPSLVTARLSVSLVCTTGHCSLLESWSVYDNQKSRNDIKQSKHIVVLLRWFIDLWCGSLQNLCEPWALDFANSDGKFIVIKRPYFLSMRYSCIRQTHHPRVDVKRLQHDCIAQWNMRGTSISNWPSWIFCVRVMFWILLMTPIFEQTPTKCILISDQRL